MTAPTERRGRPVTAPTWRAIPMKGTGARRYEGGNFMLTNKKWWKAALIRAVKTIAQSAVSMVAVGAAISEVDWLRVLSVSAVAGVLSLLTSLAGLPEVEDE